MMSEIRKFRFQRGGLYSAWGTAIIALLSVYFIWRIGQVITGSMPPWVALVAGVGLIYMWYMRLAPVKAIGVARDGRVIFIRGLGRREVHLIDIKTVSPWLNISKRNFILKHANGWEFLFEDPVLVATVVHELARLNPGLKVRGVPKVSGSSANGR